MKNIPRCSKRGTYFRFANKFTVDSIFVSDSKKINANSKIKKSNKTKRWERQDESMENLLNENLFVDGVLPDDIKNSSEYQELQRLLEIKRKKQKL